jgi:hypothetical protein
VGEQPDNQRPKRPTEREAEIEIRRLTTDAAILAAPTIAVYANHVLNKPKVDPPPKIEIPPAADRK